MKTNVIVLLNVSNTRKAFSTVSFFLIAAISLIVMPVNNQILTTFVLGAELSSSFGITSNDTVPLDDKIRFMKILGVKWVRVFMSPAKFFKENGEPDFDTLRYPDALLSRYKEEGIHPYLMVYQESEVIGSAGQCTNPDLENNPWPEDLWHSPPADWEKWEFYLKTLVGRYGKPGLNAVQHWEISFEENVPSCPFAEDPQIYVEFLRRSGEAIKGVDHDAKIVLGRLLPRNNIAYLRELLRLGAGDYFDVVSVGGPYNCERYENAGVYVQRAKEVLDEFDLDKPIWLTEGECSSDANGDGVRDPEGDKLQEIFVREFYTRGLTAGAEKVFFNGLFDRGHFWRPDRRSSGLVDRMTKNFEPKPSFWAYQRLAKESFPGDANGDGRVDSEDFALLVEDYLGETVHNTDFNSDGRVDIEDFAVLQLHYKGNQ